MSTVEKLDRLIADQLQAALSSGLIGRQIVVLEQTGSTNDAILEVDAGNSNDGLVLFAEHQTAGRGQRGNRWESPAGKGLWFSILLKPEIKINHSGRLTIWAMESVRDVIRTTFSLEPTIKLPNDVQLYGRKVAGVLVEMRAQKKATHLAVVGIGINVNQSLQDFPPDLQSGAISLAMALRRPVNRQELAIAVLRNLDRTYCDRFVRQAS
jgi:BirA family transcriptional regulator, biotin operon repressor / biotin---[acetyl-CoA-carboxylase] ligase